MGELERFQSLKTELLQGSKYTDLSHCQSSCRQMDGRETSTTSSVLALVTADTPSALGLSRRPFRPSGIPMGGYQRPTSLVSVKPGKRVEGMKDRVALVTGAGSPPPHSTLGIGRATSLVFAREGAKVMAGVDLNGWPWPDGPMLETVGLIIRGGGEASGMTADVSKAEEVQLMVSETVSRFGRIDAAFNNAGIHTGTRIPFHEYPEDEWDRVIGVNLKGVWLCIKYELPQMLAQGGGAIVNTSSVAGLVASSGTSAYTASKHGVAGLTKSAAMDYARQGIRVNAVAPGVIMTPMMDLIMESNNTPQEELHNDQPIGRMGKPEEIAEVVVWLCTDAASYVTGHVLPIDGGYMAT